MRTDRKVFIVAMIRFTLTAGVIMILLTASWLLFRGGASFSVSAAGESPVPVQRNADGVRASTRLQAEHFQYLGAFRLPDEFNWGARGMTYHPDGGAGAGSLLVTGFQSPSSPDHPGEACWNPAWDCYSSYGRVSIPDPAVNANWEDLPMAGLVGGMINYDQGLVADVEREYVFVSDIEYFPRTGSQSGDKIYGSADFWYDVGTFGENTFPTIWMANLDGTGARGLFHVGPEETPYHGTKMGAYLFSVPGWYANQYLGGRRLVTGRSRGVPADSQPVTTHGGSQGPTLFAFHALDTDAPAGNLDALPLLYYRVMFPGCAGPNIGPTPECDYPGFTMCDDWTGGAFVDAASGSAILLLGYKGLGGNCYGNVECADGCSDGQGYHCNPYERQVIFYDVHDLGEIAQGRRDPWSVLPYEVWRPEEFYLAGNVCWNAGGMAFDSEHGRLFMVERGLGEGELNAAVVHVWRVSPGGPPPETPQECIFDNMEQIFPEYLQPAGATTVAVDDLAYRYYAGTEAFIGMYSGPGEPYADTVFYLGPLVPGEIIILGNIQDLANILDCQ